MEENKTNQISESILDSLERCYQKEEKISEEKAASISDMVIDQEEFCSCVRDFKDKDDSYKSAIAKCDDNIKGWQESKKMWQERQNDLKDIIIRIMKRLNMKNTSKDGTSVTMRSTKVLEIDAEKILIMYKPFAKELRSQLPPYIKVTLSIDKIALSNHVKDDPTILVESPEIAHWKENDSVTLR